jgi:lipoprotein-releasing system permease protein
MVVAMALMTGYREALMRKLTQGNAAVMVYPLSQTALDLQTSVLALVESLDGVAGVRRVAYGQGSLRSRERPDGVDVTLRGIDPGEGLSGLGDFSADGVGPSRPSAGSVAGVVLGRGLMRDLAPTENEVLRLMVLGVKDGNPSFSYRSVQAVGSFASGLSEFDQRFVLIDRATLEASTGTSIGDSLYEVLIEEARATGRVSARVRETLGGDYLVMDWQEQNRELFTALRVQQITLFFVLGLIVLVSTFNVASSLLVLVRERTRDIGVLAALGLSPIGLRRLFVLYGGGLSLTGVVLGILLGSSCSYLLTRYELIRFDPELAAIYFLSSVPLEVKLDDLLAVALFTLTVSLTACWLPARRLGRLLPATALRTE